MEEPKANQMDQIDAPAETTGSILADQGLCAFFVEPIIIAVTDLLRIEF